jgi:hypothetical protein
MPPGSFKLAADQMDFSNCADFITRPVDGNPVWATLHRIEPSIDAEADVIHYCYHDHGIEVICEYIADPWLSTIYLYPKGTKDADLEDYRPFAGTLPYPLVREMSRTDIIAALGEPAKIGGGVEDDIFGYRRPWIKYYPKTAVQLMIELEDDRIWRVNVGKAFY